VAIFLGMVVFVTIILSIMFVNSSKKINKNLSKVKEAIKEWEEILHSNLFFDSFQKHCWLEIYKGLFKEVISFSIGQILLSNEKKDLIKSLKNILQNLDILQEKYNKQFVEEEKEEYKLYFMNVIPGQPFDDQQIEAIISNEVTTIVVAGAGTGKTSTIIGKTAYIIKKKLAEPSEVLLIAFTKKAADEMEERVSIIDSKITVKTFHALGYSIVGNLQGYKPNIVGDGKDQEIINLLQELFYQAFEQDNKNLFLDFFAFSLKPEKVYGGFKNLDEYYNYVKSFDLRTIREGKIVKSFEELKIANYLYLNGIDYEYEPEYKVKLQSPDKKLYHPDFYLPQYDIYIEHFGIDRKGNVPHFFQGKGGKSAKLIYNEGIDWKRKIHQQYGTKLLETYSYENHEKILLQNLEIKLKKCHVQFNPVAKIEVLEKLKIEHLIEPFIEFLYTFLNLVKSNMITVESLAKKAAESTDQRFISFVEIFRIMYIKYDSYLRQNQLIDFNDMISLATNSVNNKEYLSPFKFIIVDEFQDLSYGRYLLLKSLMEQKRGSKLFAVGDDWQSIFRFTGADISLINEIEKHFGVTLRLKIETTYRFNNKILEESSKFIQKNSYQFKKQLKTKYLTDNPGFEIIYINKTLLQILAEISELDANAKVLLIGRYSFNIPENFSELKKAFRKLNVDYVTAHKSKGLTCDYSILLNLNSGKYGFPTEVTDDPILNYILHEGEPFENAEERRLFYVAITRAKHKNYIITSKSNKSKFVRELEEDLGIESNDKFVICEECGGKMEKRTNKRDKSEFWGCTNFPLCKNTVNFIMSKNFNKL
jgi:DNA helicase-4